jgi:predicted anti-sigma-YlaC factor YlaD
LPSVATVGWAGPRVGLEAVEKVKEKKEIKEKKGEREDEVPAIVYAQMYNCEICRHLMKRVSQIFHSNMCQLVFGLIAS